MDVMALLLPTVLCYASRQHVQFKPGASISDYDMQFMKPCNGRVKKLLVLIFQLKWFWLANQTEVLAGSALSLWLPPDH